MAYSFAHVSAAVATRVEDYFGQGNRGRARLTRKAASSIRCPATNLEAYLDSYLQAAGIVDAKRTRRFRSALFHSHDLWIDGVQRVELVRKRRTRPIPFTFLLAS